MTYQLVCLYALRPHTSGVMAMNENKIVNYAHWIIRHRWWVILSTIAFIALAMTYMALNPPVFKSDYRVFFSPDNPQLIAFEDMQNTYNKSDNVLMVITPKDGNVFTPKTLQSIQWLTEEAWKTPYKLRVDSITNFQHTWARGEDDLVVKDLICYPLTTRNNGELYLDECSHHVISKEDIASFTEKELIELGNIATSYPALLNRLISEDKAFTGVNITVQLPDNPITEVEEVASFVRNLAKEVEAQNPNIQVHLTGLVMMNVAFPEATFKDFFTLYPLMLVIVLLALWALTRTLSGTISSLFIFVFCCIASVSIFFMLGGFLSGPIMNAPIIILTMAVADTVHVLSSFQQNRREGLDKTQAMVESLRINMQPIFLTSITTAIGFLSMNFSDVPPLRHMGNVIAMGVGFAFIFSVTFLPAAMSLLPVKSKGASPKAATWMDQLSLWVIKKRNILLPFFAISSIAAILFIPQNELNDEFVKYFDKSVPFRNATDYSEEHLTGLYNIFISAKSGEENGINATEYLGKIEQFSKFAQQQPEVLHVETLSNTLKQLNRSMHADDQSWYRLPDSRELSAQYLLLYEMSLPQGLDLTNQIDVGKSSVRLGLTLKTLSSNQMIDLEKRINTWFKQNAPDIVVELASPNLMFAHIGARTIKSSLIGTSLALVLISAILIFSLRSLKMGFISLIPNLIPAGIAFGLWGLFVGQVGMSLSIVVGMTLGIVVDDTVHFLSKYLRARREKNMNTFDATRYAFKTVGVALTATTLILVAGFFILTFSTFTMNSDMGKMTALTIAVALIVDFLLLPPLLMKIEEKDHETSQTDIENSQPVNV